MRGDGFAIDPPPLLGEPFDVSGGIGDFVARFCQRITLFARQDEGQVLSVFENEIESATQEFRAIRGQSRLPLGHGDLGSLDRLARELSIGTWHEGDFFARGRIIYGMVRVTDPVTTYVHLLPQET